MGDMKAQLERLRTEGAEIGADQRAVTDPQKRTLFANLADELNILADAIERDIASRNAQHDG
jgi:hypothetical protein